MVSFQKKSLKWKLKAMTMLTSSVAILLPKISKLKQSGTLEKWSKDKQTNELPER